MFGLTLDQAPPYKIPLFYYMIATFYLLLLSGVLLFYATHINTRYDASAIAITHLLTLGFVLHAMFGTLFQMVPVIIGEAYKRVGLWANILLVTLNLGIISFIFSFLLLTDFLNILAAVLLLFSLLVFSLYSLVTIARAKDKNASVKTILTSLLFLAVGTVLGALSLLQYSGNYNGVWLGDIHLKVMLFGWVFLLYSGVIYKILPMFYVAREYPLWVKNGLYIAISTLLMLLFLSTIYELTSVKMIINILLATLLGSFALLTLFILKRRKRARLDVTVNFFYFANGNLFLGCVLCIASIIFGFNIDFLLALVFGLGFVYAIVNAMLYKIIPFLTWFHLSSSCVYEAEMGEVMKIKRMKIQFYIFTMSYAFFLMSVFFRPLIIVAALLFFLSSLFLFKNIIEGFLYYKKMIKKTPQYNSQMR